MTAMTILNSEDPADQGAHEPRVTGAPEAIWLVYGELEHDDTHANCADSGEVTWCEDGQFPTDVQYMRADLAGEQVRDAVAAERERNSGWFSLVMNAAAALEDAANCLRDPDAKRAAEGAAKHYRAAANALWDKCGPNAGTKRNPTA